jgi:catechol 1,2-dioxygenase
VDQKQTIISMQNRREFLISAGLTAISLSVFGCVVPKTGNGSESDVATESTPDAQTFKGDCTTTDDILGPFYRQGAPMRGDLVMENHGEAPVIEVSGVVFTDDCTSPISNVSVEIWQANEEGDYDNKSSEYRYRGSAVTDANGRYTFKTIVPGRYMNGNQYRPSHIHFRVTDSGHQELVSQLYFKEDPYIANDPWASQNKAKERICAIEENAEGYSKVNFNIYLASKG